MILSDMRYLALRGKLRNIMRDTRDRVSSMEELAKELETTEENTEKERKCFQKYFNGIDYNRTLEFYNALRDTRQEGTRMNYLGITVTLKEGKYLIRQAKMFAKKMVETRKEKAA